MNAASRTLVLLALLPLLGSGPALATEPPQAQPDPPCRVSAPGRVVAIGDLHGDLRATRAALRLAGAIDEGDRWIGGDLTVVQTGDQIDRGEDDRAIMDLFERLAGEARAAGGAVHSLVANHEYLNVNGVYSCVAPCGFEAFEDLAAAAPRSAALLPYQHGRAAAFSPGGPYARKLAERCTILVVNDTAFVHAGLLPQHVAYGLERLNREARRWLRGELAEEPGILEEAISPTWIRLYSLSQPGAGICWILEATLDEIGVRRLVVGHTVQPTGINAACDGKVWRIDTGMSAYYGGTVQILEIVGQETRVLKEAR
jgi:hypothetical protein